MNSIKIIKNASNLTIKNMNLKILKYHPMLPQSHLAKLFFIYASTLTFYSKSKNSISNGISFAKGTEIKAG
jgi:hypothetical protein